MKKILLIILTGISINAFAQVHWIGIQGGVNLTNRTDPNTYRITDFRTGIICGFNYEYLIKGKYSFGADLLYIQQGFTEKLILTDQVGISIDYYETKFRYNYLSLPVKFGYTSGHKIKGFAKMGVYPSVMFNTEITFPKLDINGDSVGIKSLLNIKNNVSKFDLGGLIELGASYGLYNNFELISSITYRHSITSFSTPGYFDYSNMRHYGFSLSIGLKYKLNKK